MKQATFPEGIIIALLCSVSAAAIFMTMSGVFFAEELFRFLTGVLTFVYIMYLFARGHERFGRLTITALWFVITLATFMFIPSLALYILIQILMIWLIRSLCFYNSVLTSLLDLVLTGISLVVAVWAWSATQSLFLTFWSFFLLQALFVYIPKKISSSKPIMTGENFAMDKFDYAYKTAEVAIRKLAAQQ